MNRAVAKRRYGFFGLAVLVVLLVRPVAHHVRALLLLLAFSDARANQVVREETLTLAVPASAQGPARHVAARLYAPPGDDLAGLPAVVLVHGVQYMGIEEPRLQRFAKAIVRAGIVVLTPQIDELADYQVSARSIETVGAAIDELRRRTGHAEVGLMGTSFGGGISLLTAADARFRDRVGFVVAVGAHDDLARVSRFFATGSIPNAEGALEQRHAHEYGATVLVYARVEDFFPVADVPAARDALRFWLQEKRDLARAAALPLSPASKEKVERLFAADVASIRPELLASIERRAPEMATVSPHDRLASLTAHTYLLHGAGDSVIPPTESGWLAKDVPAESLRDVLVSPAIVHVELDKPGLGEQWALVHFMANVVDEAEALD